MKLFSRKALAAVATTAALTVSGMTAPAFADTAGETTETTTATTTAETNPEDQGKNTETEPKEAPKTNESSSFGSSSNNEEGESSSKDMEAKEIREWIGVFTAIIGALSTVFVFAQRIM